MDFRDFPRAIGLLVASLATAYTLAFINAGAKGGHAIGAAGAKFLLMCVALAALLVIIRNAKTQWGVLFGSVLVVVAASQVARWHQGAPEQTATPPALARQTGFPKGTTAGCDDVLCRSE
jgi:hypothetical protein